MSKKIVSFYKFKKLNNIDNLRNIIFRFMKKNSILGTIILAKEGINTNIDLQKKIIRDPEFINGGVNIHYLEKKLESYSQN